MLPTSNFAFLTVHDPQLVQLGALAERYFRDDPGTAIFKLRQFAGRRPPRAVPWRARDFRHSEREAPIHV